MEAGLTQKCLHKLVIEHDKALQDDWRESLHTDFQGNGSEFVCVDETSTLMHSVMVEQCLGSKRFLGMFLCEGTDTHL
jgi:hypothetical protein